MSDRPKFLGGTRLGCEDILKLHLTIYGISGWTPQGPRTESDQGSGSGVEQKKKKKKKNYHNLCANLIFFL